MISTTSPWKRTDYRCVRDSLFSYCRESLLLISKGCAAAIPPAASAWFQWRLRLQVSSLQKLGHPPSSKQSSWSWMGCTLQTSFLSLFFKFPLLYYYFAILLFYFSSHFSDPINVVSLEMVCTVVRGGLGRESSCKVDAGMLYLIALCDCPSLCSWGLCTC